MPAEGQLDSQSSRYEADKNVSTYSSDNGILVLPVMGPPGTPPKIIQVHSPYGFRTVNWAYKKKGAPPVIPAMANTPSGDTLLSTDISLAVPSLGGNQNVYDYTAAGVYEYVQTSVRSSSNNFQTGRQPYQAQSIAASILAVNAGRQIPDTGLVGPNEGTSTSILRNFGVSSVADWIVPLGNISIDASNIAFDNPKYQYFDTGISHLFFSDDLIL